MTMTSALLDRIHVQPPTASTPAVRRRDADVAGALFSTWVVIGLFVDGWAHNNDKPETFFTPWHGILYAGFIAASVYFALDDRRQRRRGTWNAPDPTVLAGFALFGVGGALDMGWHTLFGVERDVEALLSPTHLVLMAAGLLLVTATVRERLGPVRTGSLREFAPAAVGLTLMVAIVSFFLQFVSALHVFDRDVYATTSNAIQTIGIAGVFLTSAILTGTVLWARRRWGRTPFGTYTLMFGGCALLMSGLTAFASVALVVPIAAGGLVADLLERRGVSDLTLGLAVPAATWLGWFGVYQLVWGLGWAAELWMGTVVFTMLTGAALSQLTIERREPRALAPPSSARTKTRANRSVAPGQVSRDSTLASPLL
jgi:hypothetical protein